MNQREVILFRRVYRCVSRLGTVGPRNPADIGGLAKADLLVSRAAPDIASAISCIGFRDYADAEGYLASAEDLLGVADAAERRAAG